MLYSDLRIAKDQEVSVVCDWSFAGSEGIYFHIGQGHQETLLIGCFLFTEGCLRVSGKEIFALCFDDEDNIGDLVNVLMEGGGVEGVGRVEMGGFGYGSFFHFLDGFFEEKFVIGVIFKKSFIEEYFVSELVVLLSQLSKLSLKEELILLYFGLFFGLYCF